MKRAIWALLTVASILVGFLATTAAAQEKLPASKIHGYMDVFQILEQASFYDLSPEDLAELHSCAMKRIFMEIRILKGTTLQKDLVVPSCFSQDRYAVYHTSREVEQLTREHAGKFFGVGVSIEAVEQGYAVVGLVPGGPADKNGLLKVGDVLIAVSDPKNSTDDSLNLSFISFKDMPSDKTISLIVGPDGSVVTLKVLRGGKEVVVQMTRGPVEPVILRSRLLEPSIGYMNLTTFNKEGLVGKDIIPALEKLASQSLLRALVIDLRGNGGGLRPNALEFAELFSPAQNRLMVEARSRVGKPEKFFTAGVGQYAGLRLAVLVDGASASASELLAGVLQLWGAKVVGTKTFGKGSIQTVQPISDGASLRYTRAKFFFENGKTPDGQGIAPDIVVENPAVVGKSYEVPTPTARDLQLERAVEYLRKELSPKP